ncbi:translation initiation factor IF-2, partial [Culicoidibacter larvae]
DGGNRQGGGYQGNRDGGNRQGGGYQGNRDGGNRQGGGYQGNRDGGNRQGGGYQGNRDGGNRQQSGGFNNNNRKLEKQISEIKSDSPAQAENRSRIKVEEKNRVTALAESEEKKSKKVLKEEQRREQLRIQEEARKEERRRQEAIRANQGPKVVKYTDSLTVGELSQKLGVPVAEIIKYLLGLGILATINHDLDADAIELIASEYDAEVEREETVDESDLDLFFEDEEDDSEQELVTRPPVVTIMGHVDHGKTTLLDAIRDARVVEGEFGGITQHIGAYQVAHNGKEITFLDTPGHEAFTSMRARGAEVTDIAIIVVAADDGVMPQTKEAVEHALAANVPIIVAVNKMDKPGADPTRVMQGLTELGLQPEEWGGSTIYVKISAKKREGIDDLLEMIQLVAELHDYKANKNRRAIGTVIEARLDKGRGSVATLLVQSGTLNIGDPIVVGDTYGRVRTMENDLGKRIKTAGPSTPIELTGLVGVPSAGDKFVVFESEKKARQIGEQRATQQITEQRRKSSAMSLEDLNRQIVEGEVKEINVIVKADVQGSAEAVAASLAKIDIDGVRVKIVRSAVGAITESDVLLAVASNAIIYGFNVRPDANTRAAAEREGVEIRLHTIIYKAIEEMEAAMTGMLDPEFEEVVIGQIEVRETFKVSKIGTIAGGYVTDGLVKRDSQVRLIREGIIIYDGSLGSLKRFQNDAKEVSAGYECGLTIENYNDIKAGDVIEAYEMQEIKK